MRTADVGLSGWWHRFLKVNRAICDERIAPRLHAIGHVVALDCLFDRWVASAIREPRGALLEFGCGRTFHYSRRFDSSFETRLATDIDLIEPCEVPPGVVFRRCTEERLPFEDASADVVIARSVLEHVREPSVTFRELSRVLKAGGVLCCNLPNKWDYVSLAARLLKGRKGRVLHALLGMDYEDVPVFYRCNTRRSLMRHAARAGFRLEVYRPLPSAPVYLSFFVPAYVLGSVYQFLIGILCLDVLQPSFVVRLRKADGGVNVAPENRS